MLDDPTGGVLRRQSSKITQEVKSSGAKTIFAPGKAQ